MPLNIRHGHGPAKSCRARAGLLVCLLMGLTGCATLDTLGVPGGFDDIELFKPLPLPPDFDRTKALTPLARIPGDPPLPPAPSTAPSTEPHKQVQRHMQEAHRLFTEQRFSETISELEKALRYETGYYAPYRLIAVARALLGNETSARFYAQRALTLKPDDLTCHFLLAWLADREQKTEDALRGYRLALKCPDDDPVYRVLTHYYLGLLLDREGYYAASIAQLQAFEAGVETLGERVKENPDLATIARVHRVSTLVRMARAQDLLERYAEAAEGLERAVDKMPEDASLRVGLVRRLVLADRIDDAIRQARRFMQDSNGSAEAVKLLLAVYYHLGRPREGLREVKQLLVGRPEDLPLALIYTEALIAAHEYDQAVAELEIWAGRFPDEAAIRWRLAEAYRTRGQWSPWLLILVTALAEEPTDDPAIEQALDRLTLDQAQKIIEQAGKDTALRAEPNKDAALDYLLGGLCDRLDRVEQAREHFHRARRTRPEYLPATIGEARLDIRRCRWSAAIETIKAAGENLAQPDHRLHTLLGQCHEGLDQLEQAIASYEKAIQLKPADTQAMFLLGLLFERIGITSKARQCFQSVVTVDPENLSAREALAQGYMNQLQGFLRPEERNEAQKRLLAELKELEARGPHTPATRRTSALFRYLFLSSQNEDRQEWYIQNLAQVADDFPDDLRTHELLATTLFAFRAYPDAAARVAEMLKGNPYAATANELHYLLLIRDLKFTEAMEHLQKILQWYPNRMVWIQTLANLYLLDRRYDEAIALWERLLSLEGVEERRIIFHGQLLRVYQVAQRFEEARERINGWMAGAGKSQRKWYMLRLCLIDLAAKDYARCIENCRQWLANDPDNPDLRSWLLLALRQAGRFDEAALTALNWLSARPDDSFMIDSLAHVLIAARRHDEAIELLSNQLAASDKLENQLMALDKLVNAHIQAGHYAEAIIAAEDLIARDQRPYEEKLELYEKLGGIYIQAGRFDEAVNHYHAMLRQAQTEEEKAQLLRRIGFMHQRQGRLDLTLARLREAYDLAPADIGINNDLGYTLADMGRDLDEAEQMTRLAVGEEFMQPAYLDSLGWVMYKKGRLAEARLWLERARTLENGEDPVILDHLGDVYWRLGERERAGETWQKALQIQTEQRDDIDAEVNEEAFAAIQAKLEALRQGGSPQVATMPAAGE